MKYAMNDKSVRNNQFLKTVSLYFNFSLISKTVHRLLLDLAHSFLAAIVYFILYIAMEKARIRFNSKVFFVAKHYKGRGERTD